jgi:SnoaL-like domain
MKNQNEMMMFCDRWLSAFNAQKPDDLIQFYAKNALYIDPNNPEGLKGHDEILPYLRGLFETGFEWEWEKNEVFPTDNGFTLKLESTFKIGKDEIKLQGLSLVIIKSGRISRNEFYFDRSPWVDRINEWVKG